MEALLPSEIARLILGYLEDQKCTEAAKLFLETSPHLQECRAVLSHGRRFSTRVNGLTLIDIVEKFSAISAMIQERLSKATDCEQLKHCGDLVEQLKFLVEEPRGQRFVVNINVPSQSNVQTSSGSPITASNMRKRHHSNSERNKRNIRNQLNSVQQSDIMSPPGSCHNVDTTPLESLPGNIDLKQMECVAHTVEKRDDNYTQESHRQCNSNKNNSTNVTTRDKNIYSSTRMSLDDVSSVRSCEMDIDDKRKEESASSALPTRYTTATSTEELLSFSSTEVQTIPYEIPESESESNDEPIENLSILTKEILNRTELQECIAENINKAIIPTDLSFKDENLNESMVGEGNTSIMTELNNAIKSIVEATESDPVFEKFLNEIIGPHTETDTSPEEDGEGKLSPKSVNDLQEKQIETVADRVSSPEPIVTDKVVAEDGLADVPLKHRLRSSSRQQYNRLEDEIEKARDQEKDQIALEDQNAAAVLSIINANITNNVPDNEKRILDTKELIASNDNNGQIIQTIASIENKDDTTIKSLTSEDIDKGNNVILPANNVQSKVKKATVKRPRPTKPKRDQTIIDRQSNSIQPNAIQPITEHEIMTMPTLIMCSKDEVNNLFINRSTITSTSTSRFIPIAPKDPNRIEETVETLFLRTVNVAQKVPIAKTLPAIIEPNSTIQVGLLHSKRNNGDVNKQLKVVHKTDAIVPISIDQQILNPIEPTQTGKIVGSESITLYSNETNAKTSLDSTNMPTINLEENISLSGSGFSPYLKFNCTKTNQSHNLSDIDLAPVMENARNTTANNNEQLPKNVDNVITKRTPKSLLKSRSKNHRLSLSTPRKRSSHIRALDFSTPTRTTSSTRKTNADGNTPFSSTSTKRLKSVCRTSLFRSPSISNTSTQKQKSPIKICQSYRIPIATRSPAPKLMGGWDKCNGVGVIIGEVSPHGSTSASCSSSEDKVIQRKPSKPLMGSWDADLRKCIESNGQDEPQKSEKPTKKRKSSIKDKNCEIRKKIKCNSSTKSSDEEKNCNNPKVNRKCKHEDYNEPEENSQGNNRKITELQNNGKENVKTAVIIIDSTTNKSDKISDSINIHKTVAKVNATTSDATIAEKKPVKKYAQLKTISTNLKKLDNERGKTAEVTQINSQTSEISKILSADSTQHILRMPDMINLETPRKFDNISGPPPTPRVLSPSSSLITPFIKVSEDSTKIRSFITTPEFPITPGVAITPKEETTRDIIKRSEYNSSYYKPTSEQVQDSDLKPKDSSTQESPILSSSHIKLHSMHNSLASDNTYQTSSSKLEITEFEVIKENLPREEAIKEFKIASTSKDLVNSPELNAAIVIDRHVDLIEINEFKDINEHCETVVDANDSHNSVESSSSSSDTSSSSSSSSTSSSSNTNTSTNTCSPNGKCDKGQSKMSTDSNSGFAEKNLNAPKNTTDALMNIPNDACKQSNNALTEMESSPRKVFAIAKTDNEIQNTLKETPAKDETLLNEADISETPSSSKSGVESLTNLTTKISAIITEDEKLSKQSSNKLPINKTKALPKIIDIQCIQPGSSKFIIEPLKSIKHECQSECEPSAPVHDKFMHKQLLEEKRQRIMAKIRDNSKLNLPATNRKRILTGKVADTLKKFGRGKRIIRPPARYSKDVNKNIESQDNRQETLRKNTRRKFESQTQSLANKCNNEKKINQASTSKDTDSNLTNYKNNNDKPLDNNVKKQLHENNICDVKDNLENCKKGESMQSHKNSSENQEHLKEKLNIEEIEKNYDIKNNIEKEETGETLKNNMQEKILKETNSEKHIVVQEMLALDKLQQENRDQTEDKINKSRQPNHIDESESYKILRYKVDQVKRDLFSDDENDYKTSLTVNMKDNNTKYPPIIPDVETQNSNLVPGKENVNVVENPKEELSTVLQCLQLVPASKKEHSHSDKNQNENQYKEQREHETGSDNESHQTVQSHNYKAEYHFVYDDTAPIRKRRRRYSGHELQIEINYADLSDPNPVECIKIMKATEFEEIFNLPPKSKKRTINKKPRVKNEKVCETPNKQMDAFNLKDDAAKPLATSSPMDEPLKAKTKKIIIKTAATNKTNNNTQSDTKKKQKLDKQEKVSDITKNRKRKLSETKETKQVEKKCTTDPQTLLNNLDEVDLNKFLTTVHGPE